MRGVLASRSYGAEVPICYWSGDESRVGILTVPSRKLTGRGIKPIGVTQWEFCYRWFYGLVEPRSGESFLLEFSHLDQRCFEAFLTGFAQAYPQALHVIQVDNAPAHRAQDLHLPESVVLLFQPPYCPEVNPTERLWREMKRDLAWQCFDTLGQMQQKISQWVQSLRVEFVKSLVGWDWILDGLSVAEI